jgi:hypothetical protein
MLSDDAAPDGLGVLLQRPHRRTRRGDRHRVTEVAVRFSR